MTQDEIRAEFVDDITELICTALQRGIRPEDVQADVDAVLSIQIDMATDMADPKPAPIPADEVRKAVSAVLGFANDFWQPDRDEPAIIVEGDRWTSPGTFDSARGSIAIDGDEYVLTIDGECDEEPPERAYVSRETFAAVFGAVCPKHGATRVASSGSYTGYAGGLCYVTTLECGCSDNDETNDIRAAE